MGFRFQRRIKIMPGVTLNVGKRGVSTSFGRRGAPGGVVAASLEVSVLRAWDAEALGSMSGMSSSAGAAAAGGCGALPRVRAGV